MSQYADTDFLYIDPDTREVKGRVEWSKNGNAKPLEKIVPEASSEGRRWRKPRKEYFIWGSYRSLKRLYHLEGKEKDTTERTQTLDDALSMALNEAYWESSNVSVALPGAPEATEIINSL